MVDNYLNYLYINKISVTTYRQIGALQTISITLLPGINLLDFYCQNLNSPAGLIYYVTHSTTGQLLCQSNGTLMYRLV